MVTSRSLQPTAAMTSHARESWDTARTRSSPRARRAAAAAAPRACAGLVRRERVLAGRQHRREHRLSVPRHSAGGIHMTCTSAERRCASQPTDRVARTARADELLRSVDESELRRCELVNASDSIAHASSRRSNGEASATVRPGATTIRLKCSGALAPLRSKPYRSPGGRCSGSSRRRRRRRGSARPRRRPPRS